MKLLQYFIALAFMFTSFAAQSQYSKYIVRFSDKNNTPYKIEKPSAYLSQRAINRRTRYNIAIDSNDIPVNTSYINRVASFNNVAYLSQSKWLNAILISCHDTASLRQISKLPFVINLQPVEKSNNREGNRKPKDFVHHVNRNASGNGVATQLNYGKSFQQIHIHNGEFLHDKGYTGNNVQIAILDAGFYHYKNIAAFDSARSHNQFLGEKDFVAYDNSVNEDDSHGELCLSTIASNIPGTMVGTAPKASFWLIRTENNATENLVEEFNWVAGAEYVDSCGADLISSSVGYNKFDDSRFNHTYNNFYNNSTIVSEGAAMAANKGMIVTNSAGNEGANSWKYIIFPADADSVCAVGAVSSSGIIASFSSYGYKGKVKPNVVSVGAGTVVYTSSGVASGNGTSFSNPNMNGLIACLWQAFPAYNNATILKAVYASADRFTHPDNRYGFGIPNMKTAYRILKRKQNTELYGSNWLLAKPDTFSDKIETTLIGVKDGSAVLNLTDANGKIISTINLQTEQEEVYDTAFNGLQNLTAGAYYIQYKDDSTEKKITVLKAGNVVNVSWLKAYPVPFNNTLNVAITAQETAQVTLKLMDVNGKVAQTKQADVQQGTVYNFIFSNAATLSTGNYYIEYQSKQLHTLFRLSRLFSY